MADEEKPPEDSPEIELSSDVEFEGESDGEEQRPRIDEILRDLREPTSERSALPPPD